MSSSRDVTGDANAIELDALPPSQFNDSVSDHVARAQRQTMSM
jgi:hypothetical protein